MILIPIIIAGAFILIMGGFINMYSNYYIYGNIFKSR